MFSSRFRRSLSSLLTLKRMLLRSADRRRWSNRDSFSPDWDERARIMASLVPSGSRIIEFGAGLRRLEGYLDSSCIYVPSDLVSRGPDTIVLDLESRPLPALPGESFDVAIFAGVLEYLSDVPRVIAWICRSVPTCILSYECATGGGLLSRVGEIWYRAAIGWENAYTDIELQRIFLDAGFHCVFRTQWGPPGDSEPIFVYSKTSLIPGMLRN